MCVPHVAATLPVNGDRKRLYGCEPELVVSGVLRPQRERERAKLTNQRFFGNQRCVEPLAASKQVQASKHQHQRRESTYRPRNPKTRVQTHVPSDPQFVGDVPPGSLPLTAQRPHRRKAWTQRGGCRTEVHVRDRTTPHSPLRLEPLPASDEIRSIGVTKRDLLAALRLEHLGE